VRSSHLQWLITPSLSYWTNYKNELILTFVAGPITQEWLIGLLSSNRLLVRLDKIYPRTNFQTYSYCI
jgi:hypothetical protein